MGKVKKGLALVLANALYQTQPVLLSCNKDGLDNVFKQSFSVTSISVRAFRTQC